MKKAFYSLIALIICNSALLAQGFSYQPSKDVTHTITDPTFSEFDIIIKTPSPEDITYKWKLLENSLPAGWSYSLCDHGHCFIGIPDSAVMDAISSSEMQSGVNGYFKLTLMAGENNYGSGTVRLYVFDQKDVNRGDILNFNIEFAKSSSVSRVSTTLVSVYPNPAKSAFTVRNDFSTDMDMQVFNNLGQHVLDLNIPANTATQTKADLPKGVYFLRYTDNAGTAFTERLVIGD